MTYSDDVLTMPSKTFSGVGKLGGDAGGKPPSGIPLLACTLYQRLRPWREWYLTTLTARQYIMTPMAWNIGLP